MMMMKQPCLQVIIIKNKQTENTKRNQGTNSKSVECHNERNFYAYNCIILSKNLN